MENQITIREAVTENDVAAFWEQLHAYHKRDIFPDSDDDELEYFLGSEYHDRIMEIYPCSSLPRTASVSSWNTASIRSFAGTEPAGNAPECCLIGQKNAAHCMQSLTAAAASGGGIFGKTSALWRTVLTSGEMR